MSSVILKTNFTVCFADPGGGGDADLKSNMRQEDLAAQISQVGLLFF